MAACSTLPPQNDQYIIQYNILLTIRLAAVPGVDVAAGQAARWGAWRWQNDPRVWRINVGGDHEHLQHTYCSSSSLGAPGPPSVGPGAGGLPVRGGGSGPPVGGGGGLPVRGGGSGPPVGGGGSGPPVGGGGGPPVGSGGGGVPMVRLITGPGETILDLPAGETSMRVKSGPGWVACRGWLCQGGGGGASAG